MKTYKPRIQEALEMLHNRWKKCINLDNDYVENWWQNMCNIVIFNTWKVKQSDRLSYAQLNKYNTHMPMQTDNTEGDVL